MRFLTSGTGCCGLCCVVAPPLCTVHASSPVYLYGNFYLKWHKLMDIIGPRLGKGIGGYLAFLGPGGGEAFNGRARVRPYCICVVR